MSGEDRLASEIDRLRREPRPFSVANVVAAGASSVTANLDGVEVEIPVSSLVGARPAAGDRVLVAWQGADPILVGGGIGTGGGTQRPWVIAAADTTPKDKAFGCDVVCTGTNDETILTGYAAAPVGVLLLPGTYHIDAECDFATYATIRGLLTAGTFLRCAVDARISGWGRMSGVTIQALDAGWSTASVMNGRWDMEDVALNASQAGVVAYKGGIRSARNVSVSGATTIDLDQPQPGSTFLERCTFGDLTVPAASGSDGLVALATTATSVTVDLDDTVWVGCTIGTFTDTATGTVVIDGSGGGGATDLAGLADVADGLAPSDGQVLTYDMGAGEWDAAAVPAPTVAAVDVTDDPTGRSVLTNTNVGANLDAADSGFAFMGDLLMLTAGNSAGSADANYTIVLPVRFVTMTGLTAARTVTLPAASGGISGSALTITVRCDGTCSVTETVTITPDGTDTINGAATLILDTPDAVARLVVDPAGGNWLTV